MILECNFADLWSCQAAVRAGFRGGNRSSFGRNAMRLLARLVSGIFKNILDMIVKCIYRDLEQGLVTATSVNVECLRLSLLRACVCEDLRH